MCRVEPSCHVQGALGVAVCGTGAAHPQIHCCGNQLSLLTFLLKIQNRLCPQGRVVQVSRERRGWGGGNVPDIALTLMDFFECECSDYQAGAKIW